MLYSIGLALVALTQVAQAQVYTGIQDAIPVNPNLTGTTKSDGWYNLTNSVKTRTVDGQEHVIPAVTGYPAVFTSGNEWPSPIASQVNSGGPAAQLNKIANGNGTGGINKFNADGTRNSSTWDGTGYGPYPAGDGLYAISFSNVYNAKGGSFGIFETAPVADLGTVVLQLEIGSANGYDFWDPNVPSDENTPFGGASSLMPGYLSNTDLFPKMTLTLADTTQVTLAADLGALLDKGYNGTIPMPTGPGGELVDEPIWVNLYGFTWDLSAYDDIASYYITWDVVEHSQSYGMRLDQSSDFHSDVLSGLMAVPEPGANLAVGLFGGFLLLFRRRRCQERKTRGQKRVVTITRGW